MKNSQSPKNKLCKECNNCKEQNKFIRKKNVTTICNECFYKNRIRCSSCCRWRKKEHFNNRKTCERCLNKKSNQYYAKN